MNALQRLSIATVALLAGACASTSVRSTAATRPADPSIPHLRRDASRTNLIVDGRPFLILGGEVGNSNGAAPALNELWPAIDRLRLNSVLVPAYWELLEPTEGHFDFSTIDDAIAQARAHDKRLVLLWFGAWKNSMSTYVPAWVKADSKRFVHARRADGTPQEILSAFDPNTLEADARAYVALLEHLKRTDSRRTVVMMQVENEVGFLPDAREHGPLADAAWEGKVPAELMPALRAREKRKSGFVRTLKDGDPATDQWAELVGPGPSGEELFQAWHYARYCDELARRGKAVYPIPTYVNCALNRPGREPGQYPSAGPLPHLIDVWKAGAPDLDLLSPDIYFYDFSDWAGRYARPDNALFIPETMRTTRAAANAFNAFANLNAIGFSPFDIESTDDANGRRIADAYAAIDHLRPLLTGETPTVARIGVEPRVNIDGTIDATPRQIDVGRWHLTVSFDVPASAASTTQPQFGAPAPRGNGLPTAGGAILFTGENEYTVVGIGLKITHATKDAQAGLERVEQWRVNQSGKWERFRVLNGDETNQGREVSIGNDRVGMQAVRLYAFE